MRLSAGHHIDSRARGDAPHTHRAAGCTGIVGGFGFAKVPAPRIQTAAFAVPVVEDEQVQCSESESGEERVSAETEASKVPPVHGHPVGLQFSEQALDADPASVTLRQLLDDDDTHRTL